MTLQHVLNTLRTGNVISEKQHDTLLSLVSGSVLSLYWEIQALFYIGVLCIVAGVGIVVKQDLIKIGPLTIIAFLSTIFAVCLAYCWLKAASFDKHEQPSPNVIFDYLLYGACALFAIDLSVIGTQFHLIAEQWDNLVLASALLYFSLAYRFDNRFVLSLALVTLAGWCGIKIQSWLTWQAELLRPMAILFAMTTAIAGFVLARLDIKKHFLNIYLNIAANTLLLALVSGVFAPQHGLLYLAALLLCCGGITVYGMRTRQFLFVCYGVVYSYVGLSSKIINILDSTLPTLLYLIVSSVAVVAALVMLARRFKESS